MKKLLFIILLLFAFNANAADQTIHEHTALSEKPGVTDEVAIWDLSVSQQKRITTANYLSTLNVDSYGGLETAVSTIGATADTVIVDSAQTLTGDLQIPATLRVQILKGGSIDLSTHTLTFLGTFQDPGIMQVFDASSGGSVVYTANMQSIIRPAWYGADASGDDEPYVQYAADDLVANASLIIDQDLTLGDQVIITDKNDFVVGGKGSLTLSSADSGDYIFKLSGTLDNVTFQDLELIGEDNNAYTQTGVGMDSGQTISNITYKNLRVRDINVGLSLNANTSGTITNGKIINNYIDDIRGTSAGSGYGIHLAKAYNTVVSGNQISDTERHAIYYARGDDANVVISSNVIRNHRISVGDGTNREAIVVARSSGVIVANNSIVNFKDGGISVEASTAGTKDGEQVIVSNNLLMWPKNDIPAIWVGEQSTPTSYLTQHVSVIGNEIHIDGDDSIAPGIYVYNGAYIFISGNHISVRDVNAGAISGITLGNASYINADAHFTHSVTSNNFISFLGADASNCVAIRLDSDICGNTSTHHIFDNLTHGLSSLDDRVYPSASLTNPNIIFNRAPNLPMTRIYTDGDTTPNVQDVEFLYILNTGATSITDFDNASRGQLLTIVCGDAGNTTIVHDDTKIQLNGDTNYTMNGHDTLQLVHYDTIWNEVSRR